MNTKSAISYGIILFKYEEKKPKILMINRKDSLCYIEFIRGKYDINNVDYMKILVNKFNNSEKEKILTNTFEDLWRELWLIKELNSKYSREYSHGFNKFTKLKKGYYSTKYKKYINLKSLINDSKTNYTSSEWEFPKGRKNYREANKACAIREFKEETNYDDKDYELIINIKPLSEVYLGENKIKYTHIYYIGKLTNTEKILKIDKENNLQCSEINDLKWLNKEECLNLLRDYHISRRNVINKIFKFLNEIENYKLI